MSTVMRYQWSPEEMYGPVAEGEYVRFEDYSQLLEENRILRKIVASDRGEDMSDVLIQRVREREHDPD